MTIPHYTWRIITEHPESETKVPPFHRRHFKCIYLAWKNYEFELKLHWPFPNGPTNNIPSLVAIIAWHRPDSLHITFIVDRCRCISISKKKSLLLYYYLFYSWLCRGDWKYSLWKHGSNHCNKDQFIAVGISQYCALCSFQKVMQSNVSRGDCHSITGVEKKNECICEQEIALLIVSKSENVMH